MVVVGSTGYLIIVALTKTELCELLTLVSVAPRLSRYPHKAIFSLSSQTVFTSEVVLHSLLCFHQTALHVLCNFTGHHSLKSTYNVSVTPSSSVFASDRCLLVFKLLWKSTGKQHIKFQSKS